MNLATDTAKTVGHAVRSLGKDLIGRDYCVTNEVRVAISGDFIMAINSHKPPGRLPRVVRGKQRSRLSLSLVTFSGS